MQALGGVADVSSTPVAAFASTKLAHTIAVGSGKGGVGKSTCALALAWAAAERGVKTALIDADFGLANQDILCGLQPVRTAADWLAARASLADCFVRVAPRLWLLPGASGVARLADLQAAQRERLLQGLARVAAHVDLMVVDLGAGLGAGTLDIAAAADKLLVVCTPEPTSVSDAYGFVKACVRRGRIDPVLLAVNASHDAAQADLAAARMRATCARFLDTRVDMLGVIPSDEAVRHAVHARRPLMEMSPRSEAARALRRMEGVVNADASFARAAHRDASAQQAASSQQSASPPSFVARLARALGIGVDLAQVPVVGSLGSGFRSTATGGVSVVPAPNPRAVPAQ
jgi:flagellar biosynthesis protein FlhG